MRQRERELWRKIAHVLIGSAVLIGAAVLNMLYGSDVLDIVLFSVLAVILFCDVLIADYGWKLPLYHHLQRKHEQEGLHTATLGLLGGIIAYKFFALPVAIAAIAMLIYGDSAAAIVGLYTKGKKRKTITKTTAMLIVSITIGWFVFGWIGAIMGVIATIAEAGVTKIDDALTIPIFAGLAGQILTYFL